jgi:hypothetical protein
MKLFVKTALGEKIYLQVLAPTKSELAAIIGSPNFFAGNQVFHVNEVLAEKESSNTTAGMIIGGLLGLIVGPWGAVTGSTAGALIGNSADQDEEKKISIFNKSYYGGLYKY